ncbi:mutator type transposase [Tanacetum coccineum]
MHSRNYGASLGLCCLCCGSTDHNIVVTPLLNLVATFSDLVPSILAALVDVPTAPTPNTYDSCVLLKFVTAKEAYKGFESSIVSNLLASIPNYAPILSNLCAGHTPKSVTLEIHYGWCFTPTPSRSYIDGQFLIPRLGLDYGLHPLNVDADVLEMGKYVNDYKIILVYVKHGSSNVDTSIFVTPKKGVAIAVDNHLRKALIEIDNSPDMNRNSTPMCHKNLKKEWEYSVDDPFEDLDEILDKYGNTRKQIHGDEITRKKMAKWVGPIGKFKEVEVDADNESEEESGTKGNDTSGSDSEYLEDDLDVIDYDSFGSDLDDGINYQMRIQLRELRRIGKLKNKGPNKYYFYLGQQFATKEIMTGRVRKHSVETRRKLIMVKNDKEMVRVRREGTIPALVPYVASDTGKNVFSQIKGGPVIKENGISGKQNILGKDKTYQGKGITVRIDAQQEPNPESLTRTFRRVYECLGALKQGFRACGREILGLDACFMSGPWPSQILTVVGVDANNMIYPVAYAIVEAESKASWCWFLNLLGEDLGIEANFSYTFIFDRKKLVDDKDQPIITCLEYIKEYLVKRIVVVQKVIAKTVVPLTPSVTAFFDSIKKAIEKWELIGIPCKHVVAIIYNMSKNSIGAGIPEQWAHAAYKLETWLVGHQRRGRSHMMKMQVKAVHQESFLGRASQSSVVNVEMWVITRKAAGVKVERISHKKSIKCQAKKARQTGHGMESVVEDEAHQVKSLREEKGKEKYILDGMVDANNMIYPVAYAIVEAESKASWFWFLNLLGEDLGRAKCDLLLNNICEVFNRQLVDGKDQPIITCLEYIREYLVKRIVVVQKVIAKTIVPLTPSVTTFFDSIKKAIEYIVKWNGGYLYQVTGPYRDQCVVNTDIRVCSCRKWELTGIPCKHVVDTIYNMSKNSIGVGIPEQWVHAAYKLETWAHVYSLKVNPFGRPPEKRKKSHDENASKSCSSGKLSRKGNQAGARNVSGQAYARQDASAKNVFSQDAGVRNASSQSGGSSQPNVA